MSIPVTGYYPALACAHEATHQHGDEVEEMRHVRYIELAGPGLPATLVFDC